MSVHKPHSLETYHGLVKTPADAIRLFEACRRGHLPRVQRRLSEKERQQIRSGSVFVWDEKEAGMRRWTDGKSWSASRVSGSFLTYREMEGKRAGSGFGGGGNRRAGKTPDSGRGSDEDHCDGEPEGYRYKQDGLMKQSFSITTSHGQHLHLISYYRRSDAELLEPSKDPTFRDISIPTNLYPESNLHEPSMPATMRGPMHGAQLYPPPPQAGNLQAYSGPYSQPPATYPQPGVAWPPSPVATPPAYSPTPYQHPPQHHPQHYPLHHRHPQYPHHPQHPESYPLPTLPPLHHAQQPSLTYSHGPVNHHYLPPPSGMPPLPQPYPLPHSPHQQYRHHTLHPEQQQPPPHAQHQQRIPSPHSAHAVPERPSATLDVHSPQHLQATARKAAHMIDSDLGRSQAGPLPALSQQLQNTTSANSPPHTTRSSSPPGNRSPERREGDGPSVGNSKVTVNSLLQPPDTAHSESGSSNSGANGGNPSPKPPSPRTPSGGSVNGTSSRNGRETMEARAIGALDKNICAT